MFLNIRTTQFDHSSPVQPNPEKILENLKKSFLKNSFNSFCFFFVVKKKKKKNAILLVFQYKENAIRPELSSKARFRIQGGGVPWAWQQMDDLIPNRNPRVLYWIYHFLKLLSFLLALKYQVIGYLQSKLRVGACNNSNSICRNDVLITPYVKRYPKAPSDGNGSVYKICQKGNIWWAVRSPDKIEQIAQFVSKSFSAVSYVDL